MPMLFFLPFIIASGMFSVATESLTATTRKSEPQKRER
jgi:hypothetical protein